MYSQGRLTTNFLTVRPKSKLTLQLISNLNSYQINAAHSFMPLAGCLAQLLLKRGHLTTMNLLH